MTRSCTCSVARNVPLCFSMASTSVVLPWSTWAMMAMLRIAVVKTLCPHDADNVNGTGRRACTPMTCTAMAYREDPQPCYLHSNRRRMGEARFVLA